MPSIWNTYPMHTKCITSFFSSQYCFLPGTLMFTATNPLRVKPALSPQPPGQDSKGSSKSETLSCSQGYRFLQPASHLCMCFPVIDGVPEASKGVN